MNRRANKKFPLWLLTLFIIAGQIACADLAAIRKFTEIAAQANEKFGALAGDLTGTCLRQKYYDNLRRQYGGLRSGETNPAKLLTIADLRFESSTLAPQCALFNEQQVRLVEANKVLTGYLQTMAELAADDLTSYDKSIDGLGDAFSNGNIFNEGEVNAVIGLAKLIIKASTEGYRQKQLSKVIGDYNDEVQQVTAGLGRIITMDYLSLLANERQALHRYYQGGIVDYLRVALEPAPATGPGRAGQEMDTLPIAQIKAAWDRDEEEVHKRFEAAVAYGKVLKSIAEGHQKLYEKKDKISDREVLRLALQYGKTISAVVEDFRKTF